jgi:hypothetical protein
MYNYENTIPILSTHQILDARPQLHHTHHQNIAVEDLDTRHILAEDIDTQQTLVVAASAVVVVVSAW